MINTDDQSRRAYWAEQMEAGYAIVQKLIEFPVNECGERFASIPDAAAAAGVEMLFSTTKIAGDLDRVYFLRESLVRDVITIGREMNERGWILKIEDAFRSLDMQRQLVRKPSVFDNVLKKTMWELGGQIPTPEMMFRRASCSLQTCQRSAHTCPAPPSTSPCSVATTARKFGAVIPISK